MDPHDALLCSEAERLGVDPEAVAEARRMRADWGAQLADERMGEERPGRLTTREFSAVILAGILDGPTELIAGRGATKPTADTSRKEQTSQRRPRRRLRID